MIFFEKALFWFKLIVKIDRWSDFAILRGPLASINSSIDFTHQLPQREPLSNISLPCSRLHNYLDITRLHSINSCIFTLTVKLGAAPSGSALFFSHFLPTLLRHKIELLLQFNDARGRVTRWSQGTDAHLRLQVLLSVVESTCQFFFLLLWTAIILGSSNNHRAP